MQVTVNGTELLLRFESAVSYSIWVPETIQVVLPDVAVLSDNQLQASPQIIIWATPGSVTLEGELIERPSEETLSAAGSQIKLRLDDDRWVPGVALISCSSCPSPGGMELDVGCPCLPGDLTAAYADPDATFSLLEQLQGTHEEPGAWKNVIHPLLVDGGAFKPMVWRVDDFTLNLTLPQQVLYDITAPETLSFVIPASSVLSAQHLRVAPIVVLPTKGSAYLNGTILHGVNEAIMRSRQGARPLTLHVLLLNDSWVPDVGLGNNKGTRAFAQGIKAHSTNRNQCTKYHATNPNICIQGGWMDIVQPSLLANDGYHYITRLSDSEVRGALS